MIVKLVLSLIIALAIFPFTTDRFKGTVTHTIGNYYYNLDDELTVKETKVMIQAFNKVIEVLPECKYIPKEAVNKAIAKVKRGIGIYKVYDPDPRLRGQAIIGANFMYITQTLINTNDHIDIAKTVIHELMHLAGYKHVKAHDEMTFEEMKAYVNSVPVQAAKCIK